MPGRAVVTGERHAKHHLDNPLIRRGSAVEGTGRYEHLEEIGWIGRLCASSLDYVTGRPAQPVTGLPSSQQARGGNPAWGNGIKAADEITEVLRHGRRHMPGKLCTEECLHDDPEDQRVHLMRQVERAVISEPRQELGAMPLHDGQVGLTHRSTEKRKQGLALMLVLVRFG